MGIEVVVEGLSKSFGRQTIWQDVSLTLPAGEVSVMLGPSGTGKTVFLKSLIGLIKPERGRVMINGVDMVSSSERRLHEIRKLFGIMFQDGALFGSLNLYENIAFPLREHTKKKESEIRRIVLEKMDMVGLAGAEGKLPGEISGGMRKRAGLARALVLDPEILLVDEPDSGLDPVRTAYLSQLLIDLNAQIDATMLIVTHNIDIASTVPDNMGMLFRRGLVTFGPREVLLTSEEPVVFQFLRGRRAGPIGMSEEKDAATLAMEQAQGYPDEEDDGPFKIPRQLRPSPGMPPRKGAERRRERVLGMLHQLPPPAQQAILENMNAEAQRPVGVAPELPQRSAAKGSYGPAPAPGHGPAAGPVPSPRPAPGPRLLPPDPPPGPPPAGPSGPSGPSGPPPGEGGRW
ncbi:phospholipid/cholesterol/gamma-HCH transport system ATP-binding protein [Thermomonospora echinospora]|uniref:Phospholipid/cholesterol/gamma-HCH transport system ATP-binding protein n=1 Tax=Thermomonospora echinospora TaxID=1992 RepID=A0A1H5Y228_9ACTN|nr:ATP-binding cassette domain-containing protein [Thermomonospora echinospora]SEG17845.1 phospholipid/cholesterol/gamma-HCH transport system ATP-binding protein [Thermomonospora echinospora]